jgi:hypothetical protein
VPAKTVEFSHGEQCVGGGRHTGTVTTNASRDDILRLRLRTQRIDGQHEATPAQTVRHFLAMQAQDFPQALWAVASRTPGTSRSDVLAALDNGEIVRSLPMRGTLHFVAPADLSWMLDLTSARTLQSASTRFLRLGLDQATLARAEVIAQSALAGGNRLSRAEFVALLEANDISAEGQRGYHVIFYLTQRKLICWGPTSAKQQALVLLDEWVPAPRILTRDESLREFAVRYFTSHGPATVRDFAWWTQLTLTDARAAIALAAASLTELTLDDVSYWIATAELDAAAGARFGRGVRALPGFDEYLLGYQDRSLALAAEHANRIVPGSNGIFLPTIVERGRVVGTWRRSGTSRAMSEPEHFVGASDAELASFGRAASDYEAFTAG